MNLLNKDILKVDMHIHTTASDGTWGPEELIEKLIENNIEVFSVTDHNNVENISNICKLAKSKGLKFIPGVEIETYFNEYNYHILGYGIDPENDELIKTLKRNTEIFERIDEEHIRLLEKNFLDISILEYDGYVNNPTRGGWKTLNYLKDKGMCTNHKEFFTLIHKYGAEPYIHDFLSPKDAAKAIINAGGIPVLAHPGAKFYDQDFKSVIESMVSLGIRGIECFHPDNSTEVSNYCLDICLEQGLVITGGSDCHGDFIKDRKLGFPDIINSQLNCPFI